MDSEQQTSMYTCHSLWEGKFAFVMTLFWAHINLKHPDGDASDVFKSLLAPMFEGTPAQ